MKSSYLTRYLAMFSMVISIVLAVLIWFYIIGTNDPIWIGFVEEHLFINANVFKIISTIICVFWVIRSITFYEFKIVQFAQADYLKAIFEELKKQNRLRAD